MLLEKGFEGDESDHGYIADLVFTEATPNVVAISSKTFGSTAFVRVGYTKNA